MVTGQSEENHWQVALIGWLKTWWIVWVEWFELETKFDRFSRKLCSSWKLGWSGINCYCSVCRFGKISWRLHYPKKCEVSKQKLYKLVRAEMPNCFHEGLVSFLPEVVEDKLWVLFLRSGVKMLFLVSYSHRGPHQKSWEFEEAVSAKATVSPEIQNFFQKKGGAWREGQGPFKAFPKNHPLV